MIEEFVKHSRVYHNLREDVTRGRGSLDGGKESIVAVMVNIESMDRRMMNMDQFIHAIRVGCDNCIRPYLTKDCDIDENSNQKVQSCYYSGDRYDEDWRKLKKEWLPYGKSRKVKEEKYKQQSGSCIKSEGF